MSASSLSAARVLSLREDSATELKSADVLRKPYGVAREVVGMLNTPEAGKDRTVWIGVREQGGRAIGVDDITDVESERIRLRDHLVDVIEPRPNARDLSVEPIELEEGPRLLRVLVRNSDDSRLPYSLLFQGGRQYWRRVQDRLVPMSYDEIRDAWRHSSSSDGASEARKRMSAMLTGPPVAASGCLGMACVPVPGIDLDLSASDVSALLTDPRRSGNRPQGWTFLRRARALEFARDRRRIGTQDDGTNLWSDGTLDMRVPLELLRFDPSGQSSNEREIYPYALLEYPTSLLRAAGKLLELHGGDDPLRRVLVGLSLLRVNGWVLWPWSPRAMGWHEERFGRGEYDEGDDLVIEPLEFPRDEVVANPDACAYRLLAKVYEAFHLDPQRMPREFDVKSKRLLLD